MSWRASSSTEFYFTAGTASTAAPLRARCRSQARIEPFDERNHGLGFDWMPQLNFAREHYSRTNSG
jgi:hypothetical protein